MVDMFCLLQLPSAGDDLQAIKKGHCRDRRSGGHQQGRYRQAGNAVVRAQWRNALHMLRPASPNWSPPVIALWRCTREGIVDFGEQMRNTSGSKADPANFAASVSIRR